MTRNKAITFIDLFAGIGGMRLGFEAAGASCVLTCEINEAAIETYKHNFKPNHQHIYTKDILELGMNNEIPQHNILVAGFPCQPYSIAGLRKGLKDERGGDIFKAILRILKKSSPDAFLLENVKGIVNHENGETFKFMIKSLELCGYNIVHPPKILNSMTHANVPQNRERVFIVGFKDPDKSDRFKYPEAVKLTKTIHSCLEKNAVGNEFYYTEEKYSCARELKLAMRNKDTIYQWRRQYVRENKSNACPTLTANMGSGGHNVPLILDDFGIRKLTPREVANFQGFPKTFKLPKLANSKLYHQFGNSVTVPLIEKIAKEIIKLL